MSIAQASILVLEDQTGSLLLRLNRSDRVRNVSAGLREVSAVKVSESGDLGP